MVDHGESAVSVPIWIYLDDDNSGTSFVTGGMEVLCREAIPGPSEQ